MKFLQTCRLLNPPCFVYNFDGVMLLELAQNARKFYEAQPPQEKRRLLDILLSNCTWGGGEFKPTLKQPFDLIAETNAKARTVAATATPKTAENEIWRDVDSYPFASALEFHGNFGFDFFMFPNMFPRDKNEFMNRRFESERSQEPTTSDSKINLWSGKL